MPDRPTDAMPLADLLAEAMALLRDHAGPSDQLPLAVSDAFSSLLAQCEALCDTAATAAPPRNLSPPIAVTGDIELNLPTGCEIKDVRHLGGQIYVLTQPAGVCGQVLIVDPQAGRVTGRIKP